MNLKLLQQGRQRRALCRGDNGMRVDWNEGGSRRESLPEWKDAQRPEVGENPPPPHSRAVQNVGSYESLG